MNTLQIDSLRDMAIDYLARARADRETATTHADLYRRLYVTSVMMRGKPGTTAVEYAACNVLETVSLLRTAHDEPLTTQKRASLMSQLAAEVRELCTLTERTAPAWLADVPAEPVKAEIDDRPTPAPIALPAPTIAGRLLSTKEAAAVLGYKEQTLRQWASTESGPIRPLRNGQRSKLLWSGDEIQRLMSRKK